MNNRYILLMLSVLLMTACKKGFLDKPPDEDLTMEKVFSERNTAESFLTNTYSNLPDELTMAWHGWMTREQNLNPFVGASDEMEMSWTTPYNQMMNTGAWNPSDAGTGTPDFWKYNYEAVRKTNLFLENIHKTPITEEERSRWTGEAIFLRAFYHFLLFRVYGPVPVLTRSIAPDEDFKSIYRQPVDTVVDFIVKECDKAMPMLDMTVQPNAYGRVTRAAALALKARVLLYAASPLFNGNPDYVSVADNNGMKLFPQQYDKEKWKLAMDAAKACIEETEAEGYQLYRAANNDPRANYEELFRIRHNREVLFARNAEYNYFEFLASPNGMGGWSGLNPTQDIVDEYEMENGLRRDDPSSGYVESGFAATASPKGYYPAGVSNMYVGREPRFYAAINFNGQEWRGRQLQFWYNGGLDGNKGGPDYPSTGYLLRKYSDETVNIPQNRWVLKTWIFFRLGELYLNYAEALNEYTGPEADAYKYMNEIRDRAGLPDLPTGLSQDEMRERIRHERRIELAFETHRYFDCHRWKIAATVDNAEIHGLSVLSGNSLQDPAFYVRKTVEKRVFTAKHYLWPVPQAEINKNRNLVQNPGWQ